MEKEEVEKKVDKEIDDRFAKFVGKDLSKTSSSQLFLWVMIILVIVLVSVAVWYYYFRKPVVDDGRKMRKDTSIPAEVLKKSKSGEAILVRDA